MADLRKNLASALASKGSSSAAPASSSVLAQAKKKVPEGSKAQALLTAIGSKLS